MIPREIYRKSWKDREEKNILTLIAAHVLRDIRAEMCIYFKRIDN